MNTEQMREALEALRLAIADVDWRPNSPTMKVLHKAANSIEAELANKTSTADEPQATPIPCAVRVGAQVFDAGTPFCDVIDKALTDLDIARALLIRSASVIDDTGNTANALLLKQIDRFLMDKWNDSEAT
jgi:hypothetical protein